MSDTPPRATPSGTPTRRATLAAAWLLAALVPLVPLVSLVSLVSDTLMLPDPPPVAVPAPLSPAAMLPPVASAAHAALLAQAAPAKRGAPAEVSYGRDVRPILAAQCLQCHGQDPEQRRAELRLDVEESAKAARDGVTAVAPFSLERSELWRRIGSSDPGEVMPPPASHKAPLGAHDRAVLAAWIEAGAPYEPHWAFVPPRRPALPGQPPAGAPAGWPRNPIDHFVLAKLGEHGLLPSPEADRASLARRLFLDLTGLPPTPQELDALLADGRPDAIERLADRLLTEEPYRTRHAERLASPWLDAARYADTSGIHTDAGRSIWPWRDWVLASFRDNQPYDEFLTEQLAGDLLPDATQAQLIASGFHRNHVTTDEGGAIAEEYLVEYAVDRVSTTGSVFMGLTWGCARCHDHKFDPLSQREFFGLYAFFNSIDEPGLYSQETDSRRAFEPALAVPDDAQKAALDELAAQIAAARAELDAPAPDDDARFAEFVEHLPARAGLRWAELVPLSATSTGGATLSVQPDGSVLASGANPDTDDHVLRLRTHGESLRLLRLDVLTDPSLGAGRVGRTENGNVVLTGITASVAPLARPDDAQPLRFTWAWADHEQADGDFGVTGALVPDDAQGWALDGHRREDGRVALLLADAPFGEPGGSEVTLTLQYRSVYARHVAGRVRVAAAQISDSGAALLPLANSAFYRVGPFPTDDSAAAYALAAGPESDLAIDTGLNFGAGNQHWTHEPALAEGVLGALPAGTGATYVGRRVWSPSARVLRLSLGSDDGLQFHHDGALVLERRVDRSLSADQDSVTLALHPGLNALVAKVVNTGGEAGYTQRTLPAQPLAGDAGPAVAGVPEHFTPDNIVPDGATLDGDTVLTLLPADQRDGERAARLRQSWRQSFSPAFRGRSERLAALTAREAELQREVPRTMVMRELDTPRATYVLQRGLYDQPDLARPVERGVPEVFGAWPAGAPLDRRGLAQWLLAPDNPLTARVAVNRLWALLFGTGLVASGEDFGLQGESPSHPELLDWLAVELRENGWDQRELLRLIVTSATYRQSARARPELAELDPGNRLLASFPRRRLSAEQIRDTALYVSGLLAEQLGGPSVKPYQPAGLWEEVAMPASNTRVFTPGTGSELWRRSLYTYWKRASPPPSLMTFDAPTRETCITSRATTNTPLQALVLWNDEQFVEAARVLAQRTLAGADGAAGAATADGAPGAADNSAADAARLTELFRRCTSRAPDAEEVAALAGALETFRARYAAAPAEAAALLGTGASPVPAELVPARCTPHELAAWTLLASTVLSLDAALSGS